MQQQLQKNQETLEDPHEDFRRRKTYEKCAHEITVGARISSARLATALGRKEARDRMQPRALMRRPKRRKPRSLERQRALSTTGQYRAAIAPARRAWARTDHCGRPSPETCIGSKHCGQISHSCSPPSLHSNSRKPRFAADCGTASPFRFGKIPLLRPLVAPYLTTCNNTPTNEARNSPRWQVSPGFGLRR